MRTANAGPIEIVAVRRSEPLIASGVLGMLIFVIAEVMFFAGLISAFTIIRASSLTWPPPGQPRLPIEATAFNTALLLASGVALWVARRRFRRDRASASRPLWLAIGLGVAFVGLQGSEWVSLIGQGLTLTSSTLGSFFYLIVGLHALHAIGAIALLTYTGVRLQRGWLARSQLATTEVFWYFVVGLWPILYAVVYL